MKELDSNQSTSETIFVHGIAFTLTTDSERQFRVSRNGKSLKSSLKRDKEGRWEVLGKRFHSAKEAIDHLVYWYTKDKYKQPSRMNHIEWPDGRITKVVSQLPDNSLQLTLWQIEIVVENARALVDAHLYNDEDDQYVIGDASHEVLGKHRVYKAEIGLLVHRALELMLKVLLGRSTNKKWTFSTQNNTHSLSILHDKLETVDREVTRQLDVLFKDNVMVRGDPHLDTSSIRRRLAQPMTSRSCGVRTNPIRFRPQMTCMGS